MISVKTYEDIDAIMKEVGIDTPRERAALIGTAMDIMKRIDRHFKHLGISPDRTDRNYSGDLKRAIHWAVYNATGGSEAALRYYSQNIQSFVELAVQKNYPVSRGGMPSMISGKDYGGIKVNRGKGFTRRAKPFLSGEMRVHGRMLFDRLVKDYGYLGNVVMMSAVLPSKWTAEKANAVMKLSGWGADMDLVKFEVPEK